MHVDVPLFGFAMALLISTWSILSMGFLIASIVPTARFAQPIGVAILYPMLGLCGLFVPLPDAASRAASRGASAVFDLRGVPAPGDLERGCVVGAPRRRRGTGSRFCDLHRNLGQGLPLGIDQA